MDKCYIQITSGRGPVECCRVVVLVLHKLVEHSKQLGLKVELVEHEDGPKDGCMFSATLSVSGDDIEKLRSEWEGSVLWVAQKNTLGNGIAGKTGSSASDSSSRFSQTTSMSMTSRMRHYVRLDQAARTSIR